MPSTVSDAVHVVLDKYLPFEMSDSIYIIGSNRFSVTAQSVPV